MKITVNWLKNKCACSGGIFWFKNQKETDGLKIVKKLINEKRPDWASWLITFLMDRTQLKHYSQNTVYLYRTEMLEYGIQILEQQA